MQGGKWLHVNIYGRAQQERKAEDAPEMDLEPRSPDGSCQNPSTKHMALTSQVCLALRNPTSHSQFPCLGHPLYFSCCVGWARTNLSPPRHSLRRCCAVLQGLLVELAYFHAPLFWNLATWHAWVNRNISGGNVSRTLKDAFMAWLGLQHSCHLPQDKFACLASDPRMRRYLEQTCTQLAVWSRVYSVPAMQESSSQSTHP